VATHDLVRLDVMTLLPGDMILTAHRPASADDRRADRVGDHRGIGTLSNPVRAR
jgi:hypothetical protein